MADSSAGLASLSTRLAQQACALAEAVGSPPASPDHLDVVRSAERAHELAGQVRDLCVQQSRDAGHSWQEIGDVLGVTRQVAFQRFGKPVDPRNGLPMDKTVHMTDAAERAVEIITQVVEGRMDDARKSFTAQVATAFAEDAGGGGFATLAGLVGAFEGCGEDEPFVRRVGDLVVVDIPLRYEAGEMKGRVAFDSDEKVAGLFVLSPETP